jgi:hypothetical protein
MIIEGQNHSKIDKDEIPTIDVMTTPEQLKT